MNDIKLIRKEINDRVICAINELLAQPNANQKNLAKVFNITPTKFSEILNGRMNAGVDMMQTLCAEFGYSAQWLIVGDSSNVEFGDVSNSNIASNGSSVTVNENKAQKENGEIALLREQIRQKDDQIKMLLEIIAKK